jgi:hypothetical protein
VQDFSNRYRRMTKQSGFGLEKMITELTSELGNSLYIIPFGWNYPSRLAVIFGETSLESSFSTALDAALWSDLRSSSSGHGL